MTPWSYLFTIYRARAPWLTVSFLCLTVTWLAGAALLAVSGWFITACAMAGLGLVLNLNIFTPSAAIRGLAILRTLGRYTERVIGHEAILRVLADLRSRAFRALASQPAKALDQRRYADLVNRLMADIETLDGIPIRVIGPLFSALLTLIGVTIISAIWGNKIIAVTVGGGGLVIFAVAWWSALKGREQSRQLVKKRAEQRIATIDHLAGMAELIANNQAIKNAERLHSIDSHQLHRVSKQEIIASLGEHSVQALTAVMTLAVLFLAWEAVDAPILALLGLMTLGLNEALGTLPGALWRVGESEEAAIRLQELESSPNNAIAYPNLAYPTDSLIKNKAMNPTLQINSLVCQRQPNQQAGLSLCIQAGHPHVIFGKSGSGKTSLLETLAGELEPVSGEVLLNDQQLLNLPDMTRYQRVSFLGQGDLLINVSIRDFLSLGLAQPSDEQIKQALSVVDLGDTLEHTPEGLDYILGVRGNRISGGQARRLQLAALLLKSPDVVLLDEPFRGLEAPLVQSIIDKMQPWMADKCVVFVTHDPSALPTAWARTHWPHESFLAEVDLHSNQARHGI